MIDADDSSRSIKSCVATTVAGTGSAVFSTIDCRDGLALSAKLCNPSAMCRSLDGDTFVFLDVNANRIRRVCPNFKDPIQNAVSAALFDTNALTIKPIIQMIVSYITTGDGAYRSASGCHVTYRCDVM